jgi:hypothetical protein
MKRKIAVLIALATAFLNFSVVSLSFAAQQPLTQEEQEAVKAFMLNVIGWNNISSIKMGDGPSDYIVGGAINGSNAEGRVCIENGIIWSYGLTSFPSLPNKTAEECLGIAKNSVKAYGELFNFSLCKLFADMVPETLEGYEITEVKYEFYGFVTEDTSNVKGAIIIEKENMALEIRLTAYGLKFKWGYYRLGNYTLSYGVASIAGIEVFENGLIKHFSYSNWSLATSEVVITKEQAIEIAKPYAEAYAQNNSRTITCERAGLFLCLRNDTHAPVWAAYFAFDERGDSWVIGYRVDVLADTGEVRNHEPFMVPLGSISRKPLSPLTLALIAVPIGAAIVLSSVGIHKYRKKPKVVLNAFSLLPNKLQQTLKEAFT